MLIRAFFMVLFSCCEPRISRHCTSGRPASIMTENCRVKIATSVGGTPPPNFGILISLPFSLIEGASILWRRSIASAAPLESAVRTPLCACPPRVPFHSKVGMLSSVDCNYYAVLDRTRLCADGLGRTLRLECPCAAGDHLLQLVRIGRAGQGGLQRN